TERTVGIEEIRRESSAERLLGRGGLVVLRLGLVGAAAFLAGAVAQRIYLGRFGGTFGPIEMQEIRDLPELSEVAFAELLANQQALQETVQSIAEDASNAITEMATRQEELQAAPGQVGRGTGPDPPGPRGPGRCARRAEADVIGRR
ncbi:MAG: hypothetical protein LC799_27550, partial [Actinobacteria bacterium]|nr:hypothetical protein [Actinomycetota bacterium]